MKSNMQERLCHFVVDILLFQRSIQPQNEEIQLVKEELVQAAVLCEASYLELQEIPSKVEFTKTMKVCLDELQKANYWLRILQEADLGDSSKVGGLIEESKWIKGNLKQVRNTTKKRLIPAQGVAA